MKTNNKSGFTLLEILIVIIIIGVLASLSLPRFFDTIEFTRSEEAMQYLGAVKRGAETCASFQGNGVLNWTTCDTAEKAGYQSTPSDGHFAYTIDVSTANHYIIQATRNARAGGDGVSMVTLDVEFNPATNNSIVTVSKSGTTAFSGIN